MRAMGNLVTRGGAGGRGGDRAACSGPQVGREKRVVRQVARGQGWIKTRVAAV